jgi:DNA modification methylase
MLELNQIYNGDCLNLLSYIDTESINCCVTSPPYWALRDYGTATWEGGDINCDHVQQYNSMQSAKSTLGGRESEDTLEDKRRQMHTQYKDICAKCGAKRVDQQLGLEPTFSEYINKLCNIFDEVKRVLTKDGTCWVVIGDTYSGMKVGNTNEIVPKELNKATFIKQKQNIPDKSLVMIPFRFAIEMVNRGWILRNTIIWYKPNCMPASVKDRFTVDFEYVFFFVKNKKYWFEQQLEPHYQAIKDGVTPEMMETAWQAKRDSKGKVQADKSGKTNQGGTVNRNKNYYGNPLGRNKRAVWQVTTKPFKEAHFATYPPDLITPMIKAGCPENGIVLDPFFGAGTTGLVAKQSNKNYIGIELNPEYCKIAYDRIKNVTKL